MVHVRKGEPPAGKIRILFLGANPPGSTKLALDQEVRRITRHLRASPAAARFELFTELAVHLDDLQEALLRHEPHVLHFAGHGRGRTSEARNGTLRRDIVLGQERNVLEGELLVEDGHGGSVGISAAALADLLGDFPSVRCVVLNACYSAPQCDVLGEKLDCVIGVIRAISDDSAVAFSGAFYQALGYSKSIQEAFRLGCNRLKLGKLPGAELPRLVTREGQDPSKMFLVEDHAPPARRPKRARPARRTQAGAREVTSAAEVDVGDEVLDRAMSAIVSNVRDALSIRNEVFRSEIRRPAGICRHARPPPQS